ncbi:hypothetical protein AWC38_SpisGene22327 [Stylophora pistillata]|uniref:Integrase core domain-containing protein n=1 Tax=Stylophora pistillata TaxID=50429 RepID=A0A2B4R5F4_STYPI|nr:hypothetical protein AWC38_SpisGene22327 [Stylophora pistillata]
MAEAFNEHFTNFAQVLAQEVPAAEVDPEFYLSYTDKAFCLKTPSLDVVFNLLRKIDEKKATGLDMIPNNELIDCELDTDLHALHYVFVPIINRALKQFQGAYNNHSLRTEHNWTPLMIWTNGILSSEHASETGVQDFYDRANQDINTESYGIDPDGPESNEFDLSDVTVPPTELNLNQQQTDLISLIDPLQPVNNYGRELYQRVREITRVQ